MEQWLRRHRDGAGKQRDQLVGHCRWTWPKGQSITNSWDATVTSSGASVAAVNASYNGRLSAGQSTSFGFNGAWHSTNTAPTLTCTAS
ncbi:cellulose binding domain-containing protein [Micromonospora sp. CPCC 206061]|uniref:cellulose binding domain-containing protein n=1 Tax=Micromonospora sp. CPCC 206061 TaxID=3122410 RepID=UPI002FF129F8